MAKAGADPVATEPRRHADSIGGTVLPLERSCFEVGARLSEALSGLGDLKGLFQALVQSLESADQRRGDLRS